MSDDDFEDDEPDLEDDLEEDDDLVEDEDDDVDALDDDVDVEAIDEDDAADPVVVRPRGEGEEAAAGAEGEEESDDDVLDLDEELHPDDVEEPLDVLLQERTASGMIDEDEEDVFEEDEGPDERGEGSTRIVPRRPGEFLCSSCFLVLPRHQLADEKRMLCRDCA